MIMVIVTIMATISAIIIALAMTMTAMVIVTGIISGGSAIANVSGGALITAGSASTGIITIMRGIPIAEPEAGAARSPTRGPDRDGKRRKP